MPVVVRAFGFDRHAERRSRTATCSATPSAESRARRAARGVIDRQIRPRPYRAMKLIASGVTFSAAIVRSPSFSRSSSSTTMIIWPARNGLDGVLDAGERARRACAAPLAIFIVVFMCFNASTCAGATGRRDSPASSAARTTYLPTMSHSRLTRSPDLRRAAGSCASSVNGTICTSNRSSPRPATVRLMPSTAIDPLWTMIRRELPAES